MMRIRETVARLKKRKKHESDSKDTHRKKKGKFQKLKANIFAKFKGNKKREQGATDDNDVQFEEIHVDETEDDGFQVVKITVEEPTNDEIDTAQTVNADCHQDFQYADDTQDQEVLLRKVSSTLMEPGRLSKASLVPCVSSRISVISQRSMSNASIISIKKGIPTRTVWTQTELHTVDVNVETGASIENIEKDTAETPTDKSIDQSSYGSFEFGIDDIFSRNPVENPKLAAIRDRIVYRLTNPCLSTCDPEVCVQLLGYPSIPFLSALNRKLSVEDEEFNEEFIGFRGLDYLLFQMEEIANAGMENFCDVMKMLLVSECATSLVNSISGRDFIINHGEHVVCLAKDRELLRKNVVCCTGERKPGNIRIGELRAKEKVGNG